MYVHVCTCTCIYIHVCTLSSIFWQQTSRKKQSRVLLWAIDKKYHLMGHFFAWEQNIRYLFLNLAQCLLSPLVCDIYLDYFMQIFQRVPDLRQEYCPQAPIFYIFWINSNVKRGLLEIITNLARQQAGAIRASL